MSDGGNADDDLVGPFVVTGQTLGGDGALLGDPVVVATTSLGLESPPELAVSDDGTDTAVCWQDFGTVSNPYGGACNSIPFTGQILLCASIDDETEIVGTNNYGSCGTVPTLVFNPTDGNTLLVYLDSTGTYQQWNYAASAGCSGSGPFVEGTTACPLSQGADVIVLQHRDALPNTPSYLIAPPGLSAYLEVPVACGTSSSETLTIDPNFPPSGSFAAASNVDIGTLGVVELGEDAALQGLVFSMDAGTAVFADIPPRESLPVGPIAAGACASGFGYLAMTLDAGVIVTEQALDGSLVPDAGGLFALGGFASRVTSMAVATNGDAGLFLAVSSSAQIAVYLVACE